MKKNTLKQIVVVVGSLSFTLGILVAGGADYNNDMNWGQFLAGVTMMGIPAMFYFLNNKEQ